MNRLLILLLATASIAASGCTGIPEDVLVTIDWVAHDPETGEVLAQGTRHSFIIGEDESGLGRDLERSLSGRGGNETFTLRSGADARAIDQEVRTPQFLGSDPAEGEVPIAAFQRSIGHAPVLNETFEYNPFYQARVIALGEETLTYRFHLEGGEQRDPVPFVGAVLVSRIEEGQLVRVLEPDVGARFTVQPQSPQNPAPPPLGLKPGTYVSVGAEDGELVYHRSSAYDPALVDRAVRYEVTVRDVERLGRTTDLEEGQYGARPGSPYVNGDPTTVRPGDHHAGEQDGQSGQSGQDGHDDGHAHDGHDH